MCYASSTKKAVRNEKEKDKLAPIEYQCCILCCDLMAVQYVPLIAKSAAYYKLKMYIHNNTCIIWVQ